METIYWIRRIFLNLNFNIKAQLWCLLELVCNDAFDDHFNDPSVFVLTG